jgi:transglutaminase-like putative cysteine protease
MRYRVSHTTEYDYAEQKLVAFRMEIDPAPDVVPERRDFFDNTVAYFALERKAGLATAVACIDRDGAGRAVPDEYSG